MKAYRIETTVKVLLMERGIKKPVELAIKHYEGKFGKLTKVVVEARGEVAYLYYRNEINEEIRS